ncbi:tRNA pseudouridine(55) synthase TruB [bacterium]|nr:MAG: tRNA pseudouridine(55) synthase TruB [bacterium]
MLGVLLIRKESGMTSHDVVNAIRRRIGTRRVGHAGTLDPLATGLLVVAVGPATRFLQFLPLEPKVYVATVRFGTATDTYDAEGSVTEEGAIPDDLESRVEAAIPGFMGLIQQLPPIYSAIKVKGKPMYKYAREGQEVHREPRTVHIGRYEPEWIEPGLMEATVECSGGTYIRSLAHDLGQTIGVPAHLEGLVRTHVGRFRLEDASSLEEIGPDKLVALEEALKPMPLFTLSSEQVVAVRHGRSIAMIDPPQDVRAVGLLEPDGTVFSVARVFGNMLRPECVIPEEAKALADLPE